MNRLIAITGGIGSGKSVVSRVVEAIGYDVYDCDSRARQIMDGSDSIKKAIANEICREAIGADGSIDRCRLSAEVFGNDDKLCRLNAIVHAAVKEDLAKWASERREAFVETAILYQSGLDRMVSDVWEIIAPTELRVERVIERNGLTRDEVMKRIVAQDQYQPQAIHGRVTRIVNDGDMPLLPQIEEAIERALSSDRFK